MSEAVGFPCAPAIGEPASHMHELHWAFVHVLLLQTHTSYLLIPSPSLTKRPSTLMGASQIHV